MLATLLTALGGSLSAPLSPNTFTLSNGVVTATVGPPGLSSLRELQVPVGR